MLKLLRKKGVAKKVLWVTAIVVIISFGFFGTAYLVTDSGRVGYAGKIYGKKISVDDFNKIYQHARVQALLRHGENFNKVIPYLNLDAETWDRFILLHEAKKRKIKVNDNEVIQSIQNFPFFQKNSRFNRSLYDNLLRYVLKIDARDFEESVRGNLVISKLYAQQTASITVQPEEIFSEYKKQNEQIQVHYVLITPEPFMNEISFDLSELKKYYSENKSQFLTPASINASYIRLDISATDQESEKDAIREKAELIFQDLLINPNMEDITQENDLEFQKSGFFSVEQPDLSLGWSFEILQTIFAQEVGYVLEPYETSQSIDIIKIDEKREAFIPAFNAAREKIQEAVIKTKAKILAKEKAHEYLLKIQGQLIKSKTDHFLEIIKSLDLKLYQTPKFSRGKYLPIVGISKYFQEASFQLNENEPLSSVVETAKGYSILHLDSYYPADIKEYEKEKNIFTQSSLAKKRTTSFSEFLSRARLEANLDDNISRLREQSK